MSDKKATKPFEKPDKPSNFDQKPSTSATPGNHPFKRPQQLYPKPISEIKVEQASPPESSTITTEKSDKRACRTKEKPVQPFSSLETKETTPLACVLPSFGDFYFENASRAEISISQADTVSSIHRTRNQEIPLASDSDSEDGMSAPRFCLTKENYDTWIVRMKCLLVEKKLWLPPDTDFAIADQTVKDKASDGYAKIIKHCDDDAVRFLEANAKENSVFALKALEERKEGEGPISKVQIINEIAALKWTTGTLEAHIDRLQQKYRMLTRKGFDVPEVIQVSNLMCSVGDKFSGVFSSFICGEESKMTFDRVSRALLAEQCRRSVAAGPQSSDPGASIANKPGKGYGSRTREMRKAKGKCTHCNKYGHKDDKCYLKHGRPQQSHSGDSKPKANSAHNKNDSSSGEDEPHSSLYSHSAFTATKAKMAKLNAPSGIKRSASPSSSRGIKYLDAGADLRNLIECKQKLRSVIVIPPQSTFGRNSLRKAEPEEVDDYDIDNVSPASQSVLSVQLDESFGLNKEFEFYSLSCINSVRKHLKRLSDFIVDSGASIHMTHDKSLFSNFKSNRGRIKIADGSHIPILGYGNIYLHIKTSAGPLSLMLRDVAYVPDLHVNLISVNELNKAGYTLLFENSLCKLKSGKQFVDIATFEGNNYKVLEDQGSVAYPCLHEWHRRLAHRNLRDIKYLKNHGLSFTKCCCSDECDACIKGKSSERPFRAESTVGKPLEVISTDICGPFRTRSLGGAYYFLTLTDAFTDFTVVKFLKNKSDATVEIKNFIAFIKCQTSQTIKCLRSDGGGEFCNSELKRFLDSEGIRHEFSTAYSPQSNGRAERKNRTLLDAARTLLSASSLPNYLWAEAIANAVYTQNRIIRKGNSASPIEIFFGKKARAFFIEFGAPVYVNTVKPGRGKLDPHAVEMKFLSVDEHSKGFRVWDGNRVIVNRNVKPKLNSPAIEYKPSLSRRPLEILIDEHETEIVDETLRPAVPDHSTQSAPAEENETRSDRLSSQFEIRQTIDEQNSEKVSEDPPLRRSKRLMAKAEVSMLTQATTNIEPRTFKQAMSSPDASRWIEAMNEELNSLQSTKTYELADLPIDRKAIGSKWVYKLKKGDDSELRYKARLVAKGFLQKFGQDYDEVFAPVVRPQAIRLLLSMAGKLKLHVNQFDVKTAFLNGTLDEEIYMKQPEGFESGTQVWRLRKSLYGLKQAARAWNQLLKSSLSSCGFIQSDADECLFVKRTATSISIIACHVDDFIHASSSLELIRETAEQLKKFFELKDLGPVKKFLGVNITRHEDGHFSVCQQEYIEKIAQDLKLDGCNAQKYPLDPGYYKLENDKLLDTNEHYRKIIGMLLYVSTNTRPDISASVCILSQQVAKPRELDLTEALRIVKYLVGTKNHELHLNNLDAVQPLTVFSDANFGESRKDGKSNSGIICFVNGGPISWSSRKQSYVAVSTCEAEFYAISEAVKETIWLRKLIHEFTGPIPTPTTLYNDNRASISMITNGNFMQRTKYVGVRCHFIADWIRREIIDLQHCATEYNTADLLTKPLNSVRIATLRAAAGLLPQDKQPSRNNITQLKA